MKRPFGSLRRNLLHQIVCVIGAQLFIAQTQPPGYAVHVRIHRKRRHAVAKQQHDGCGLWPYAVNAQQPAFGFLTGSLLRKSMFNSPRSSVMRFNAF